MNTDIILEQKAMCDKYGTDFVPSLDGWKVGVSRNISNGQMPINGLRHPTRQGTMGWYIWAGEYSDDPDFFEPIHVEHLQNKCPQVLKYLGLPPGWRFQIDDKGYEDVWEDNTLLEV